MYSGSRGIRYTAPPASDESNDGNGKTDAASEAPADVAVTPQTESDDELTADD